MSAQKSILIVDDDTDVREVARLGLEIVLGWTVFETSSGQKGVEIAAEQQPDAIFLDMMMPECDGPTTLKLLRDCPKTANIPVILLTADLEALTPENVARLGAQGAFVKPFNPVDLGNRLCQALGWS